MKPIFQQRFLMCRPKHYSISYSINPWMKLDNDANWKLSQKQWQYLHHLIIRLGGYVEYVTPHHGLPDMCFTANAAVVHKNKAYVSSFKHHERQGEEFFFHRWFKNHGYEVAHEKDFFMEGAGDCLFDSKGNMYCGCCQRSDLVWSRVANHLEIDQCRTLKLSDPYFYHLDTCFCLLERNNKDHLLYFGKAFLDSGKWDCRLDEWEVDGFNVPEVEAKKFACNAVQVDNAVILPSGCPNTEKTLREWGYDVYSCDMSEFIKAGGACKCLTLNLGKYNGCVNNSTCAEYA